MITTKKLAEQDAQRIERFKELITVGVDANIMRKALIKLYVDHTRMLLMHGENYGLINNSQTDSSLYYLWGLIDLLEEEPL